MNTQCIVYVTDQGFLFPTFVSAVQARAQTTAATDIIIVLNDADADVETIRRMCDDAGIVLIDATQQLEDRFSELAAENFAHRISKSSMGRLLLGDILPDHYTQIIYLDGDTQILSSLRELEDYEVPEGRFLAAPDYTSIYAFLNGEPPRRFFNAGVLKFNRNGWIGPEAFDYYLTNGGEQHDQGALNSCGTEAVVMVSNHWNFPKQFLHLLDGQEPAIIHYMAHPKPWDGVFFPWGRAESDVYKRAVQDYPALAQFRRKISVPRRVSYRLRSMRARLQYRFGRQDVRATELMRDLMSGKVFTDTPVHKETAAR